MLTSTPKGDSRWEDSRIVQERSFPETTTTHVGAAINPVENIYPIDPTHPAMPPRVITGVGAKTFDAIRETGRFTTHREVTIPTDPNLPVIIRETVSPTYGSSWDSRDKEIQIFPDGTAFVAKTAPQSSIRRRLDLSQYDPVPVTQVFRLSPVDAQIMTDDIAHKIMDDFNRVEKVLTAR